MKLPAVLKRVNRGLVLGALCIILVAVYVITSNASLQRQRGDIKAFLQEFFDQYTSAVLLPEQYRNLEVEVPQSVINESTAKIERFVDDYFTMTGTNSYFDSDFIKHSMKQSVENSIEYGRLSALSINLREIEKVSMQGPRYVEVQIKYVTDIEYYGQVLLFNGRSTDPMGYYYEEKPDPIEDKEYGITEPGKPIDPGLDPLAKQTESQKGTITLILLKSGGNWRVADFRMMREYDWMGW